MPSRLVIRFEIHVAERRGGPDIAWDVWVAEQQEETQDTLALVFPLVPASPRRSKQRLGHPAELPSSVAVANKGS